jgi:hypothetical protein
VTSNDPVRDGGKHPFVDSQGSHASDDGDDWNVSSVTVKRTTLVDNNSKKKAAWIDHAKKAKKKKATVAKKAMNAIEGVWIVDQAERENKAMDAIEDEEKNGDEVAKMKKEKVRWCNVEAEDQADIGRIPCHSRNEKSAMIQVTETLTNLAPIQPWIRRHCWTGCSWLGRGGRKGEREKEKKEGKEDKGKKRRKKRNEDRG